MRKITKLSFLIFVPIVIGIALAVTGSYINNETLYRVGINIATYGTFATALVLVVVSLVLMITGRASDDRSGAGVNRESTGEQSQTQYTEHGEDDTDNGESEESGETAAEAEERKLDEINSSYGYESRRRYGEYQMNGAAEIYRQSSRKDKVLGWLFLGFLITAFALTAIFLMLEIFLGAIICGALFAGTIIISLIVKTIMEKISKSPKADPDKWTECKGRVVACLLSSSTSTGGSRRSSTVRVSNVTYRIVVDVDGKEYNGYSSSVYEKGQEITVFVRRDGRGNLVKIPDDAQY